MLGLRQAKNHPMNAIRTDSAGHHDILDIHSQRIDMKCAKDRTSKHRIPWIIILRVCTLVHTLILLERLEILVQYVHHDCELAHTCY